MNNEEYIASVKQALKVEFLTTKEEFQLYAINLYNASLWGREVDRRNERIRKKDKALK